MISTIIMNIFNKITWKLIVIGIIQFLFGMFISSRREPFIIFFLILAVILVFSLIYKKISAIPIYFKIVSIISFIIGFFVGISGILPFKIEVTGPVSALIVYFGFLFILSGVFIVSILKHPTYYPLAYFFGIFFLIMAIFSSYGILGDYLNNNFNCPYNLLWPIILLGLWFFTFISFYIAFKMRGKVKKK